MNAREATIAFLPDGNQPCIQEWAWCRIGDMHANVASVLSLRENNERRCRHLLDRSELLAVNDLDWSHVGAHELAPGVIDTLVYMRDVEGFTGSYLVGLGAHRTTLADPLVATFFGVWEAEEAEHASTIGRFLNEYASERGIKIAPPQTAKAPRVAMYKRVLTRIGGPFGRLVATAHMTWGAANELLTMNGYRLLADQCEHPVLAEILRRIADQESRHYSFYLLQAQWRLASSWLARRVLPRFFGGAWTPVGVGAGYKTLEEFQRVLAVLHERPETRRVIDRMDRRFASLPGFGGLHIFRTASVAR
ncbi:MAG: ferritin-like domain-containing protein [Actinomycetota bacterium]|nr:ferritin-like domain-containing protein [Actinomycetota bacterium]